LLQSAKIYWHATGFAEDETTHPERMEHFGITTVEAMAAGCVPVVINKGGHPEIIQHGVNGFLWNTREELKQYTTVLIQDKALRGRMAATARAGPRIFTRSISSNDSSPFCPATSPISRPGCRSVSRSSARPITRTRAGVLAGRVAFGRVN
jgi:glycosyltransferase involved in cell wall biosynthesis